jgi:succinate dehydrogenase hydrophobic anchor subunit
MSDLGTKAARNDLLSHRGASAVLCALLSTSTVFAKFALLGLTYHAVTAELKQTLW